jgi:hypothetical protein
MPLDSKYKDPFKKEPPPEEASNSLAITSPQQYEEAEPFKLANVPLFTDAQGKKQVDYSNIAQGMYKTRAQDYDDNKVSRQELDDSRNRSNANTIIAGLSKASAAMGGTQSYVPETAAALNEQDARNLATRKAFANHGYENAQQALGDMQEAPLRMQKSDEILKSTDPQSELSKFSREYYQRLMGGKRVLPDSMSAADIAKFSPDIVRIASDKMQKDFQRELSRNNQQFQQQQGDLGYQRELELNDMKAQRAMELSEAKGENKKRIDQDFNALPKLAQKRVEELNGDVNKKTIITNQIDGYLEQYDKATNSAEKSRVGQQMIKLLNSTLGADAVGAEEARRLANELEPFTLKGPNGLPRIGQDLAGFRDRADQVRQSLRNAVKMNENAITETFKQYVPDYKENTSILETGTSTQPPQRRVWTPEGN